MSCVAVVVVVVVPTARPAGKGCAGGPKEGWRTPTALLEGGPRDRRATDHEEWLLRKRETEGGRWSGGEEGERLGG